MDLSPTANAAVLAGVFVLFVWAPKLLWSWRWRQHAGRVFHYRLVAVGQRPDDIGRVADLLDAVVDDLASPRVRRQGITVHRFREDTEVVLAVTIHGHRDPDAVAHDLAVAIGGKAVPVDHLALPEAHVLATAKRDRWEGRQPADRESPDLDVAAGQTTQLLSRIDGGSVSIGLEPVRGWEHDLVRQWYVARSGRADDMEGVGHGRTCKATVVTTAGDDDTAAKKLATAIPASLHRWPFSVRGRQVSSTNNWFATATALTAAGFTSALGQAWGRIQIQQPIEFVGLLTSWPALGLFVVAALAVAAGAVAMEVAVWPNHAQRTWCRLLADGVVPVERVWRTSPAIIVQRWWQSRQAGTEDVNEQIQGRQRRGVMPYRSHTLLLNAVHLAQVFAFPPQSDTAATRSEVARISAPPDVVTAATRVGLAEGTLIGHDPKGRPVKVLDVDRKTGMFAVGDPGSGKSYAVLQVFGEDARARITTRARRPATRKVNVGNRTVTAPDGTTSVHPDVRDVTFGQSTLLWLETKGDGADEAERVLRRAGYGPELAYPANYLRVNVLDPDGIRLDLVGRGDPAETAARLVDAFRYTFEPGAVGDRAAEAMRAAFTLALQITPEVADVAGFGAHEVPWMWAAKTLMTDDRTGNGPKWQLLKGVVAVASRQLAQATGKHAPEFVEAQSQEHTAAAAGQEWTAFAQADRTGNDTRVADAAVATSSGVALLDAVRGWNYYESGFRGNEFARVMESPRNKLAAMFEAAPAMWTPKPARPAITLRQLVEYHGVAILNFGSWANHRMPSTSAARLASFVTYLLWEEAKAVCGGWLAQGRSLNVYADELAMISGQGNNQAADVIDEMHNQGRSFGIQMTLATQQFDQLPARTAKTALGMGVRFYFTTENVDAAAAAARDLNGGPDGPIELRDIRELPVGHAAIRMKLNGAGQPPFTITIPDPLADTAETTSDVALRDAGPPGPHGDGRVRDGRQVSA